MTTKPIGVYVHIPYCVRKCNYCDFCSCGIGRSSVPDAYIKRLKNEIKAYTGMGLTLDTLYFGGGTPSLLSPSQLEDVLLSLRSVFDFLPNTEFTLEANPGTVNREKLCDFKSLGLTRLSVGLQSTHKNELSALGRIHTYEEFLSCYRDARSVGIDNINVDLMYGIPHMTLNSFRDTLFRVTDLSPEHLSLYGLILEEGTPFYAARDTLPLPSDDTECDMYYSAADVLSSRGYMHYEISNYAKAGFESRHNLKYWRREEYLGFGASAASFFGGRQLTNTANIGEYVSLDGRSYEAEEAADEVSFAYEYAMLRLRLKEGIFLSDYRERFGTDFLEGRQDTVSRLVRAGLATLDTDRFALTERGFYVSNSILTEIL